MTSIRSQLIRQLTMATVLVMLAGGIALFVSLRRMLLREFDRSSMLRAHALESLFYTELDGQTGYRPSVVGDAGISRDDNRLIIFSVQDSSGKILITSSTQQLPLLVTPDDPWDTLLPTGQHARALQSKFKPAVDDDEGGASDGQPSAASSSHADELTLILARDSEPLDQSILHAGIFIAITSLLSSGIVVAASVWIVRGGLRSLLAVASDAAAIDLRRGDTHFDLAGLPAELVPILAKFNDLFAMQGKALSRERQFSAAVSHELRTPIAELRSAAEIALRSPSNHELAIRSARDSVEIAEQLQTVVSTLMSIATVERSAESIRLTATELTSLIRRAQSARVEDLARAGLRMLENRSEPAWVLANASLLSAILDNLLSNAIQYATPGSDVILNLSTAENSVCVSITNQQQHLKPSDLEHLFDPFWRKDSARDGGQHVGLGLAITRTYCDAIGATVEARLMTDPAVLRFGNAAKGGGRRRI